MSQKPTIQRNRFLDLPKMIEIKSEYYKYQYVTAKYNFKKS